MKCLLLNDIFRLGSVEIKTRTVSTSEDHNEDKKKASSNNKDKTKFQGGFKPQKGQKNQGPSKEKGGGRAGKNLFFKCFLHIWLWILCFDLAPAWKIEEESKKSDHVRGKKGKMKKMKEKYKDQVKIQIISNYICSTDSVQMFALRMMKRGS